ncbi:MAG TPA: hypothetical protein VGN72_04270 [Tepidisphaeraceae bacterium]|nr:hypothetical protein [Tepidisphaeraceae bacterium]
MLHNHTVGGSASGKTALNKLFCAGLSAAGIKTVVLDPLRDGGWDSDFVTHDPDTFWRWTLKQKPDAQVALFWEEAGMSVDREDKRFKMAATTGRHSGWRIFVISQSFKQAHPQVRDMCKERWVFNCKLEDAIALAKECNHPQLRTAANLPPLHFFRVRPFKPLQSGIITFGRRPTFSLREVKAAA